MLLLCEDEQVLLVLHTDAGLLVGVGGCEDKAVGYEPMQNPAKAGGNPRVADDVGQHL